LKMIAAPQRLKAGNERSAAGTALLLMTKASCLHPKFPSGAVSHYQEFAPV
jgi:hypothetical protein